jgi:hypothetical protein
MACVDLRGIANLDPADGILTALTVFSIGRR